MCIHTHTRTHTHTHTHTHTYIYIYTHIPYLLNPFLCWWKFRLFPHLGYCKQFCNEHWSACILSDHDFLWIYVQEWDCRIMVVVVLSLSGTKYCNPMHPTRRLCPWDFAGINSGVGCISFSRGSSMTQGWNLGLLHCRWILYWLSHQGNHCRVIW